MRFDRHWSEDCVLHDGTRVRLRLVRRGDARALEEGFRRLFPDSRERRFLAPKPRLSRSELRYLTHPDGERHLAIGAALLEPDGSEGRGVGVARFVRLPHEPAVAEPALTVADEVQRKGLGRLLGLRLMQAAAERGVRSFRFVVSERNDWIRRRIRERHPYARISHGPPLGVDFPLPPALAATPRRHSA
jgi:GNAT superfamily N-acetyltransferase